jgi:hypothetical protein
LEFFRILLNHKKAPASQAEIPCFLLPLDGEGMNLLRGRRNSTLKFSIETGCFQR